MEMTNQITMTHQKQRNKRFDEKFPESEVDFYFSEPQYPRRYLREELKSHLTSEVNLTIEEVERWAEENAKEIYDAYPFGIRYDHSDFISLSDLLSFLNTLKK